MDPFATDDLRGRRLCVTGATGFIGRRLVPALLAAGAEVTAPLRSRHGARALQKAGARPVRVSLSDRDALAQVLVGQDALIHLAYDVRSTAQGNLAAFDTLLLAAERAGVGRIVHASSIVVYDGWPAEDLTEQSPMDRPGGSPYRQAKIAMERRLMEAALPCVIVQPTLVWGPGSALWTDALAERLSTGTVVLPQPEGRANLVFVDDVVQALIRGVLLDDPAQERFIVSGSGTVAWSDLLDGYAAILGAGQLRHVPHAELAARLGPEAEPADRPSAAARISRLARQALGRERAESLLRAAKRRLARPGGIVWPDRHLLELFAANGRCAIDHAERRLAYRPAFPLERGLAATEAYLKERHVHR